VIEEKDEEDEIHEEPRILRNPTALNFT